MLGSPKHHFAPMNSHTLLSCLLVSFASGCSSTTKAPAVVEVALRSEESVIRVLAEDETACILSVTNGEPPVLLDLRAKGDRPVLRGYPLAPRPGETIDHPEQTGGFTGHGNVDGHDFWLGQTLPVATEHTLEVGRNGAAEVVVRVDWPGEDGELRFSERRTYSFSANTVARFVDVEHELTATGNGAIFGDVREAFFALRLADPFRLSGTEARGAAFNADGDADLALWGTASRWVAHVAPITGADGTPEDATVVIFDHPDNLRFPTRWQVRPYGLVAANPFGVSSFEGDLEERGGHTLDAYDTLNLRYRVVVAGGALTPEEIDAMWSTFSGVELGLEADPGADLEGEPAPASAPDELADPADGSAGSAKGDA